MVRPKEYPDELIPRPVRIALEGASAAVTDLAGAEGHLAAHDPYAISLDPDRWEADGLFDTVQRPSPDPIDTEAEMRDYRWFDGKSVDGRGGRRCTRSRPDVVEPAPPGRYWSYGMKSSFRAPQTGQTQSSGMSSNAVPAGMPPSGSPSAGS
jgi:hypothetical protein